MPRRVSLPSADDLFRPTTDADGTADQAAGRPGQTGPATAGPSVRVVPDAPEGDDERDDATDAEQPSGRRRPSGRVRHDEKMTVYVTSEELLQIEHARLALRSAHGLVVDRGRLVREAVAMVLADLDAHGGSSALVRRLTEE